MHVDVRVVAARLGLLFNQTKPNQSTQGISDRFWSFVFLQLVLFVNYAVFKIFLTEDKPLKEWGAGLMSLLPKIWDYVVSQGRYVDENKQAW